jgi:hypothetical protein
VDQRLVEDRVGRHPGRVEPAGVPGHRAQQPGGAKPAVLEQRAGGGPVRGEPPVEPDLQHDPGGAGGGDRPVGVGKGQRHRLLAEHRLAGAGRGHDQVGVEPGRRGDDHRVNRRVGQHLGGIGGRTIGAKGGGQPLGGVRRGIGHRHQPRPRDPPGQRLPVEGTHPP